MFESIYRLKIVHYFTVQLNLFHSFMTFLESELNLKIFTFEAIL